MKRILVPTDFSNHAEYALKVAAQIAKKNDGEIILIHMLELPTAGADALSRSHEMPELMLFKDIALRKLDELMNSDFLGDIKISRIIQFELAFDGIVKTSEAQKIDLIVMGSHGANGFHEMFIGSNTEKVVRNSEVPVLVIKSEEPEFKADKFVFASDFSDEAKKPFEKALSFAKEFGSKLHLVNINTPNNFKSTKVAEETIKNFLEGIDTTNITTHIYNDVNVEKGILHFAKNIDADIIGMSTHGRKGLAHFFNGSISEDLVNHAKGSVITFKI